MHFDRDGDGKVSRDEMKSLARDLFGDMEGEGARVMPCQTFRVSLLWPPASRTPFCLAADCADQFATLLLENMDLDGDGEVSWAEFLAVALQDLGSLLVFLSLYLYPPRLYLVTWHARVIPIHPPFPFLSPLLFLSLPAVPALPSARVQGPVGPV